MATFKLSRLQKFVLQKLELFERKNVVPVPPKRGDKKRLFAAIVSEYYGLSSEDKGPALNAARSAVSRAVSELHNHCAVSKTQCGVELTGTGKVLYLGYPSLKHAYRKNL